MVQQEANFADDGADSTTSVRLPADLEASTLSRFDALVTKGKIICEPSTAETFDDGRFKVSFRLAPHLGRKPIMSANAPERRTGQGLNPFLNPDPDFLLSPVGPSHLLLLNKYCVYRPSLLLITKHFAPQSEDLDQSDLSAAWELLTHYSEPYMVIFNCGYEAGSSQGHKHLQLWPYPDEEELGFQLFPSKAISDTRVTSDIPGVPHKHFVLKLPPDTDGSTLAQAYQRLLREVRAAHHEAGGGTTYNVILVREWLCLIPRRHSGLEKGAGANAAAIIGLVWIVSEEERKIWTSPTLADYYGYLGIPR